ncbi:sulfurtransferase [Sulfitobacter sp. SK011]|uniref:sulfurtransferase n=1 Tax=Sulfitobacter sp. SK011 TaxID=1389004 RepID=UPI000E0C636A|nr:sulfurtransferase [Sulfitobacter sp. SK011]AXI42588.1 sulfurtransferase [Sulfitobacter sp. SK011]
MGKESFQNPRALVAGDWLEAHLSDPEIRIFDCTSFLRYGESDDHPYLYVSGRAAYDAGHIPGAAHLDLQGEFSNPESPYLMTLPSAEAAADAFARHGVAEGTRVVLYTRESMQRATRFWWMLRWLGFDEAAVLDGGYDKWFADGRPISTEPGKYPRGQFALNPRPDVFVGKDEVLAAIGEEDTCTINALSPNLHSGADPSYGRRGHIPGSVNVYASDLLNPKTLEMLSPDEVGEIFRRAGATPDKRIITYCGGGIAATLDAFLLHQLGYRNVSVYDNSMSEWAADPDLPIETD